VSNAQAIVERLLEVNSAPLDQRGSDFVDGSRFGHEVGDLFLRAITPEHGWNQQTFNRLKLAAVKYLRIMADGDFKGHDLLLVKRAKTPEEIADVLKQHDDRPGAFMRVVHGLGEGEEEVDWAPDPEDPDASTAYAWMLPKAEEGWTAEAVEHLRDWVAAYVEWMARENEMHAQDDLDLLARAADPDQIITVLKRWEDPSISFMSFVREYS